MTFSKKQIGWIIGISALLILVAIIVYVFRCDIFSNLSSCVADPNKKNEPVPAGSPSTSWLSESFPLNVGMFGTKIKALQSKLGITADGKFGPITKAAINKIIHNNLVGYVVPLSQTDYDEIMGAVTYGSGGSTSAKTLKDYEGTFIKTGNIDNVTVRYIADSAAFKTYGKNENIGTLGAAIDDKYHRIFGVSGYNDSFGSGLKIADAQLKVILNIK